MGKFIVPFSSQISDKQTLFFISPPVSTILTRFFGPYNYSYYLGMISLGHPKRKIYYNRPNSVSIAAGTYSFTYNVCSSFLT